MTSAADFEALYRRAAPQVHAYLWRRVGDAAPDLLSEIFLIAWDKRRDLPEEQYRIPWLIGVAHRIVLSHLRGVYRQRETRHQLALLPQPTDEAGDQTREFLVQQALASLSETDRELIQLTEWESLSIAEAAIALGLTAGAARVRLHRARRRLAADPRMQALVTPAGIDAGKARSSEPGWPVIG